MVSLKLLGVRVIFQMLQILHIGWLGTGNANGSMNDVRVYNRILSQTKSPSSTPWARVLKSPPLSYLQPARSMMAWLATGPSISRT